MKLLKTSQLARTMMVGVILSVIAYFVNVPVAMGIMLGLVFGAIHQLALASFFSSILGANSFNRFFFGVYFIGNFGMLAIPLYIGSVYPDFVNVFGATLGLLLHKIVLYVETFAVIRKE